MRSSVYALGLLVACLSGCQSAHAPATGASASRWTPLVEFATSLEGRTPGQRHNATLAAKRIHGAVIAPNATWSFNETLGQWVQSEGYALAPVSYGGVLVPGWGGGVCQTSTTLYNAALLSGLDVVERHPHTIAPRYIAPGHDAAVAQGIADLQLRNPYPFPCRIECFVRGNKLVCRIQAGAPHQQVRQHARACTLEAEVVSHSPAPTVVGFRRQPGWAGVRVRLWRICIVDGIAQRELCHETQYLPLPRGEKASP